MVRVAIRIHVAVQKRSKAFETADIGNTCRHLDVHVGKVRDGNTGEAVIDQGVECGAVVALCGRSDGDGGKVDVIAFLGEQRGTKSLCLKTQLLGKALDNVDSKRGLSERFAKGVPLHGIGDAFRGDACGAGVG